MRSLKIMVLIFNGYVSKINKNCENKYYLRSVSSELSLQNLNDKEKQNCLNKVRNKKKFELIKNKTVLKITFIDFNLVRILSSFTIYTYLSNYLQSLIKQ